MASPPASRSPTRALPTSHDVKDGSYAADAELAGDAGLYLPYSTTFRARISIASRKRLWTYQADLCTDVFVNHEVPSPWYVTRTCSGNKVNIGWEHEVRCVAPLDIAVRAAAGVARNRGRFRFLGEASLRIPINDDRFVDSGHRFAIDLGVRHDRGIAMRLSLPVMYQREVKPTGLTIGVDLGRRF